MIDPREMRLRRGRVARCQKDGGEHLVILRRPEVKRRPSLCGLNRLSILPGAPVVARFDERDPRHCKQQRDQHNQRNR